MNEATMVLIPKAPEVTRANDYKPISLVFFFAKLVLKIMALRRQPKMKSLVNDSHSAFIKGRSIHDNFIFVQGMIRSLQVKKTSALLLKLDIHKAFDTVSWEFLIEVCWPPKVLRNEWTTGSQLSYSPLPPGYS